MLRKIKAIILILLLNCIPSQRAVPLYNEQNLPLRHVSIYIDASFSYNQIELIRQSTRNLTFLNIRVSEVADIRNSNLEIRFWNNDSCAKNFYGLYTSNTNYILIDPNCVVNNNQFTIGIQHEFGHWLGMAHICLSSFGQTNNCSPVGFGVAIMNPFTFPYSPSTMSRLDRLEYIRALNQ